MVNLNFQARNQNKMEKFNIEMLEESSDHDVNKMFRDIRSRIHVLSDKNRKKYNKSIKSDLKLFEVEYCYIKREVEIREARKQAHQEYLAKLRNHS